LKRRDDAGARKWRTFAQRDFSVADARRLAADKNYPEFRATLRHGLSTVIFLNLIASVLLVTLAEPSCGCCLNAALSLAVPPFASPTRSPASHRDW